MAITDVLFLFLFLPLSLAVYYIGPGFLRAYILLIISLVFYSLNSPECLILLLLSVAVNYVCGRLIDRYRGERAAKLLLTAGVIYNVGILVYYKYAGFILSNINGIFRTDLKAGEILLPLGLSFFTFKAISYLADVYKGKIRAARNPVYPALYLSFFAQIQSGPLSRYSDMEFEKRSGRLSGSLDQFAEGMWRFVIGFNKKVLLANTLSAVTQEIFSAPAADMSSALAWLGSICYTLQLFFDFAGYSDMAIGISAMFGFQCPENFRYPYLSKSISEFWRRWHITLGAWFRDYVYIPLGGSRGVSRGRLFFNLFAVWILTGIWHGASWNFVVWGLLYFVVIAFEKATELPKRITKKPLRALYRIAMLFFINFQWVIFRADGLRAGLSYLRCMFFSPSNPLADARALFLLRDNCFFLAAGILLCFPVVPALQEKMEKNKTLGTVWNIALAAVCGLLFLWAVSFVVSGQSNPFAYANF